MKAFHLSTAALMTAALVSCENPADKTADATTKDAVAVEMNPDEGVTYEISSESTIKFVGSKVTGSHEGGFKEFSGTFNVGGEEVKGGSILISMDSIWSDADKLTAHLKSDDFFDVDKYPSATFVVTDVEKSESTYQISGNLSMHGVTKNITFPATAEKDGNSVKVKADFDINRQDWGISYAGKKDDLIRDEVVIRFDLVASPEN